MKRLAALCAALALVPAAAFAADALPVRVQAVLFRKILAYDTAATGGPARIIVLAGEGADDAVAAFRAVGFTAEVLDAAGAASGLAGATAVYTATAPLPPALQKACVRGHVLSLGGTAGLAEQAETAVGVARRPDGGPEIVVNLRRLRAEAHQFSAELLKLARVVQ